MNEAELLQSSWKTFCETLADLPNDSIVSDALEVADSATDSYRYFARTVAYYLTGMLIASDPSAPAFVRGGDSLYRGVGANPDNIYRTAAISADGIYRLRGTMGSCEDFILSITSGLYHEGDYVLHHETTAEKLGLGPNSEFELILGAEEQADIPITPGAQRLMIREYYFKPQAAPPATFTIERLDTIGTPGRPIAADVLAERLGQAAKDITASIRYTVEYDAKVRKELALNRVGPPRSVYGGSDLIRYASAIVDLAVDEGLLVQFMPPTNVQWCMQLSTTPWEETIDEPGHVSNLNHETAHVDADGTVRVVVSASDPLIPNWVDTAGHSHARFLCRLIGVSDDLILQSSVITVSGLHAQLPRLAKTIDVDARREKVRERQRHIAWRNHT